MLHPLRGIAVRSVLIMLLAFFVSSAASLGYTAYTTGKRAADDTRARLDRLLDTVESTLQIACFLDDKDLAREVARGLLKNPEVLRVGIAGSAATLADEMRTDTDSTAMQDDALPPLQRNIASPFDSRMVVGQIVLASNPVVLATMQRETMLNIALQLFWQLVMVTLGVIVAQMIYFVGPISRLSDVLHRMHPLRGDRLPVPPGHASTEIGRLVDDVNTMADHLVKASVARSAFLANMSHEIRTPIGAIIGMGRIGQRDSTDPQQRTVFKRILDAGTHLQGVIDDILDISKIEAGKLAIAVEPLQLAQLIEEIETLTAQRARDKQLSFAVVRAIDLPGWVRGDAMRIRQILVNLLSNAIKFTAQGRVELAIRTVAGELQFTVSDEGIGMTAEQLTRLFQPFEQADNSTTRRFGGTGLGLAISANLAQQMGGRITVGSEPGRGSRFTLHLPLRAVAPEDLPTAEASATQLPAGALAGVRCLAAEDIEVNRIILADLLHTAGATVEFAEDGQQAIDRVREADTPFDLVLMDIQMPEVDGYAATRQIRDFAPHLPIIGLTAHAMDEERQKCLAAGMQDHVSKPIDPAQLIHAIRRLLPNPPAPSAPAAAATPVPAATGSLTHPPPAAPMPSPTPLPAVGDWQRLEQRFAGKPALVAKLAKTLVDGHADAPEQLRQLLAAQDFAALAFLAHTLKGIAGNLSVDVLHSQSAALEQSARQQDGDDCKRLVESLATRLTLTLDDYRRHLA